VDAAADWRRGELMPIGDRAPGAPAPLGRTAAAHSRLLYDVLATVYDWLGFDAVDDPMFRDLVIARIVEPTSKADAQIGANPKRARCSSMNRQINGVAGRSPARRNLLLP